MRLLSTILSAFSLLLLLVVAFFWIRSHWLYEGLVYYTPTGHATAIATNPDSGKSEELEFVGRSIGAVSIRGQLTYASVEDPTQEPRWRSWSHPVDQPLQPGGMSLMRHTIGSGLRWGGGKMTIAGPLRLQWHLRYWSLSLPYWMLGILLAIGPIRWFSTYRLLARREREGRCLNCGTDLKGQTTGKCPSCGAEIE